VRRSEKYSSLTVVLDWPLGRAHGWEFGSCAAAERTVGLMLRELYPAYVAMVVQFGSSGD